MPDSLLPGRTGPGVRPFAAAADDVLTALVTTPSGLSSAEAAARLLVHGRNELPHHEPPGILHVFVRQFASPLIYVLLAAAGISIALHELKDAVFILVVLAINATIGTVQEHQANRSAEALRNLTAPHAVAVRDGIAVDIDASELVPGDVVVIESGARVPADLRLLDGSLEVDESLLTGESLTTTKTPALVLPDDATLGDRANMVFAGTMISRGRASGVVVATGQRTELGHLARSVSTSEAARPPLLVRMEGFARKLTVVTGIAIGLLAAIALLRGSELQQVFMTSVALAVAVIPESLPVAMTIALAIAVHRMSRRRVIARRLAAVEALGSCTYIASDKTGTLTRNELTVERVLLPGRSPWVVTGVGRSTVGAVHIPDPDRGEPATQQLLALAEAGVACNDATIRGEGDATEGTGDAVDVALLVLGARVGIRREAVEAHTPRVASIPFEAENQFAATLLRNDKHGVIYVKGAGERVLAMCTTQSGPGGGAPIDGPALHAAAEALAADGYRVLAVARKSVAVSLSTLEREDLRDLEFVGFVAMIDPVRPEALEALAQCAGAGVEVAMVTGDHPVTALAIARQLGLARAGEGVVTGAALRQAAAEGPAAFDRLVVSSHVFARVEPSQKLEIVESLKRAGHFVAVTGDGANDAPAMRAAHIGVAMGKRGTDVARETSSLILTDDNFASIVGGIEEGRIAYANVRKVVFLVVSTGVAELVLFVPSVLLGLPMPLFAVQLLWLNLVTNGIQDVALAFEPGEGTELTRSPRPPSEPILNAVMIRRIVVSATVMGLIAFGAWYWMLNAGWDEYTARNAVLLLMVLFENINVGNARTEDQPLLRLSPLRNRMLLLGTIGAQLLHIAAMYTPGLRDVLQVQPVQFSLWLTLLCISLSVFVALEVEKALRLGWFQRRRLR